VDKSGEIADTLLWLKNSSQPWSKVLDYWQQTSDLRWSELSTSNFSVGQYIAQYPALDNEKGYTLVSNTEIVLQNSVIRRL